MPSLLPSARSPSRRLGKLALCILSVPLASAFNHHGRLAPALPTAQLSTNFVGVLSASNIPTERRDVRLSMSAADHKHETNAPRSKSKRSSTIAAVALGVLAFASSTAVANAAKKAAADAAVEAVPLVLPTIPRLALVCLLPTLLGYYRSEYGVSYGYGSAIAASSFLVLSAIANQAGLPLLPAIGESLSLRSFNAAGVMTSLCTTLTNLKSLLPASLPAFHAFALLFYGSRLNLFLFYRELFLPRFRAMRERIEDKAKKQGGRLKRTPFIISCAFLYFCMMCPLLITSQVCEGMSMGCRGLGAALGGGVTSILEGSVRFTVKVALFGFLLGAFGDLNKTLGKALKGEDALITGGIFRFFRHPNYTGEVIGWVSSCLAGFLAVAWKASSCSSGGSALALLKSVAPYLGLSVLGAGGISFVLATATTGLEFRQKEKYGDTEEYKEWVKKSWVGFKMGPAKKED